MKFNLKLKELRGSRTQEEIANQLGMNRQTYRYYEAGERNADYDTLFKIADFYGVSIDYLLGHDVKDNQSVAKTNITNIKPIELIDTKNIQDVERNSKINIINNIINTMIIQNITVKTLSIKTNIPENIIYSWVKGENIPTSYDIQVLSLIFDVSADYLLGHLRVANTLSKVQEKDHFIMQRPNYEIVAKFADKYGLLLQDEIFEDVTKLFFATLQMETDKSIADRIGMRNMCLGYMNEVGYNTEQILSN